MPIDNDKVIEVMAKAIRNLVAKWQENGEYPRSQSVLFAKEALTALSSSGYIICQANDSGDAVLDAEIVRVHSVLLERLKLKYAGNCKCGNCFLVPGDIIMNAANLISYSLPHKTVQRQLEEAQADTATEDAG